MPLFTIISKSPNTCDCSNRSLYDNRDCRCSMHRPRFTHLDYIRILSKSPILKSQIIFTIIENNLCLMHHEFHKFNGVHVYLRSNHISLVYSLTTNLLLSMHMHVHSSCFIWSLKIDFIRVDNSFWLKTHFIMPKKWIQTRTFGKLNFTYYGNLLINYLFISK